MGHTVPKLPVLRNGIHRTACRYLQEQSEEIPVPTLWNHELEGISEGADFCKNVGCVLFILLFLCSVFFLAGLGLWCWKHGLGEKQNSPLTVGRADEELQVPSRN